MTPDKAVLHLITASDVDTAAKRARAFWRFKNSYVHPVTQKTMLDALRRMAKTFSHGRHSEVTFPWELLVDDELTRDMWSEAEANYSRNTALRDAAALRRMLQACHAEGLMDYDTWKLATSFSTKDVGKRCPPAGRYLSEADIGQLVHTCRHGSGGENTRIRDAALVMTLVSTGVRLMEAAGMEVAYVDLIERMIDLQRTKNDKPRKAYLHPNSVGSIEDWLAIRGNAPGPLWVPLSSAARPMHHHGALSSHQIWKVIRDRGAEAGLGTVRTHDLRRFVISTLLSRKDIALVKELVGHERVDTTAGYDRRPHQVRREAVAEIDLPLMDQLTLF